MSVITNTSELNIGRQIFEEAGQVDRIKIASAFFTHTDLIKQWLKKSIKVELLVSLRPPTDYRSIKEIYTNENISVRFLGQNFHSKFIIFYNNGNPLSCIIGSSNFTDNGLYKNIETNVVLRSRQELKSLESQFESLWNTASIMEPSDLEAYQILFENYIERQKENQKEQEEFENQHLQSGGLLNKNSLRHKKIEIMKKAERYVAFWKVIDQVKDIVKDISETEYPNIPIYLTIDHFWHWIVTVWMAEGRPKPNQEHRNSELRKLFIEYCIWDKQGYKGTMEMYERSNSIFRKNLSLERIDSLTAENAKLIYQSLHAGTLLSEWLNFDNEFITNNSIENIKKSLKYLLYNQAEKVQLRIHRLIEEESDLKLKKLGSSGVQELLGWVRPNDYPLRNEKADKALKALGFEY